MRQCHYNLPMLRDARSLSGPLLFAFTLLLFLSSCASFRKHGQGDTRDAQRPAVSVTDSKKIEVLPPSCMDGQLDCLQLFTARFGDQAFSAQTYSIADSQGVSMSLLNEMGMELGQLSYGADGLSFQSAYLPDSVRAEYILADFQNCYYDAEALKRHYEAAGLSFTCSRQEGREYRQIADGGIIIEEIVKSAGRVSLTNRLRSYSYELKELGE